MSASRSKPLTVPWSSLSAIQLQLQTALAYLLVASGMALSPLSGDEFFQRLDDASAELLVL